MQVFGVLWFDSSAASPHHSMQTFDDPGEVLCSSFLPNSRCLVGSEFLSLSQVVSYPTAFFPRRSVDKQSRRTIFTRVLYGGIESAVAMADSSSDEDISLMSRLRAITAEPEHDDAVATTGGNYYQHQQAPSQDAAYDPYTMACDDDENNNDDVACDESWLQKDGHVSPWEDCAHINMICGDLSGRELQHKIWDTYVVPRPVATAIPYFMPDPALGDAGEPIELFKRSPYNDRNPEDTREEYKRSILKDCVWKGVRGETWAVLSPYGVTPAIFWVVTGATLLEAIYCAHKEDPSNPQAITTMQDGVHPITLFDARTPPVVFTYLVDAGNVQNGVASKTTFVQLYNRVKDSRIAFNAYREKENIKSRNVDGSQAGLGCKATTMDPEIHTIQEQHRI